MLVREDDKEAEKGRDGNKGRRRLGKKGRERGRRERGWGRGREREKREKYNMPFQHQHSLVRLSLLIDHSAM